jgi:hypothetical protein
MTPHAAGRAEFEELLGALRDGLITPDQAARLDLLLASDPAAQKHYLEYIDLCSMLRHYQGSGKARGESIPTRIAPRRLPGVRWKTVLGQILRYSAAAASLLASALLGAYVGRNAPTAAPADERVTTAPASKKPAVPAETVAVLSRVVDAVWGETTLPTVAGSALSRGRLRLKSGLAQLEFYRGAIVVLEGPTDLELLGTDRALCRQGKVRVRASSQSSKFSVETPFANKIELGTEFGVRVDEAGGADVRVFEGKVEVQSKPSGRGTAPGREFEKGQGAHLDASGSLLADTNAVPQSFIGTMELDRRSASGARQRYRAWTDLSRRLQSDPRVVLYYTFEGQERWDRTVRDQVAVRAERLDGAIVGCQWAEGRWPGKGALEFKRSSDRVRVNIPGEYQALTLMTWVRVDGFDRHFSSLLLCDGWDKPGKLHWQLEEGGHIKFGVNSGPNLRSAAILGYGDLGLWAHLASVFDGETRFIAHYMDGREVSRNEIPPGVYVEVGWGEIGNWSFPTDNEPVRNLNGRMDEFILFDQALDGREIRAIYEAGKPES